VKGGEKHGLGDSARGIELSGRNRRGVVLRESGAGQKKKKRQNTGLAVQHIVLQSKKERKLKI